MTDDQLLTAVLVAEHAAVFGYGVLGARLDDAGRDLARTAADSHRARRDLLSSALRDRSADVVATEPAYDVAVASAAEGLGLAVRLEEGVAQRWRDLLDGTDDLDLRRVGLAGLQETAVRATQWRLLAGLSPATVALPGT